MQRRVTIQDIAKKLGIHFTTVGRGLRNDSQLAAATIRKIKKAAVEMGYQPDPNARAMVAYRQMIRPPAQQGNLVMLTPQLLGPNGNIYLDSTRQRAGELGYQIEEIAWRDPHPLSRRRLTQILKARGAAGVLVFHPHTKMPLIRRLQLDWSLFPAVALGVALLWPSLHRVAPNHYQNGRLLTRKLISLGYRRIGYFVDTSMYWLHPDNSGRAGYLIESESNAPNPQSFYMHNQHYDEAAIRGWIRRERLDAVITDGSVAANQVISLCGCKVPEELGVVSANIDRVVALSGIQQYFDEVGRGGVDLLVQLIHLGQRGIPEHAHRTLIEGSWHPGTTVRRIRRNNRSK